MPSLKDLEESVPDLREKVLLGLVIAALAVGAIIGLVMLNTRLQERLAESERQPPALEFPDEPGAFIRVPEASAVTSVAEVLNLYRRAVGRETDLAQLRTVHVRGWIRTSRGENPLQSIRHVDGEFIHMTIHSGRDPRSFRWTPAGLKILDAFGEEVPLDDPDLEARFAYDASPFTAPLAPTPRLPLLFVGRKVFRGQEFYVLEGAPGLPIPLRYYFDTRSGLLRYREFPVTAEGHNELAEYLDYRPVDGIRLAHRLLLWQDGAYFGDQTVEEVRFNVGALR